MLINAIETMPSGGKLHVEAGVSHINEKTYVSVRITDTGHGMDEELLDKIFEPFFSTKVDRGGDGLGLPISKKIMEDHGGSITVKSSPEHGASFSLNFPVRE